MSYLSRERWKLFTAAITGSGGPGGPTIWGAISGNLSDQDDLQTALDNKLDTTATTAEVDPSTDRNYVTDDQLDTINNITNTNSGFINIDFGEDGTLTESDIVITTVPALWVTTDSKILCQTKNDNVEHDEEDAFIENIISTAYNIVPGVSFDIISVAHNLTWGKYIITYNEII